MTIPRLHCAILALAVLLGGAACSTSEPEPTSADPGLQVHYDFSDRLSATMLRMQRLMFEERLTDTQIDDIRARQGAAIEQVALGMVDGTDELLGSNSSLTPAQRRAFHDLADQLAKAANNVSRASQRGSVADLNAAFEAMTTVCNDCHELYRSK